MTSMLVRVCVPLAVLLGISRACVDNDIGFILAAQQLGQTVTGCSQIGGFCALAGQFCPVTCNQCPDTTDAPITTAGATTTYDNSPIVLTDRYFNATTYPDLAATRQNAMEGMVQYIKQGYPTNCTTDEYHEYHPDGISYNISGEVILVHEPCNMESSFIAFDRLVTSETVIVADIASYLSFGSGFFHASTCTGGVPHRLDTVPISMLFARLIERIAPDATFTLQNGTVVHYDEIDNIVLRLKNMLDTSDPALWSDILVIDELIPHYVVTQVLFTKMFTPLCSNTAYVDGVVAQFYDSLSQDQKSYIDNFNDYPDVEPNEVYCNDLSTALADYIEALKHQEQVFPIQFSSIYTPGLSRTERNCDLIPHSRWHIEASDVMGQLAKLTMRWLARTESPSASPSETPTFAPTAPTVAPTALPSAYPTKSPTRKPTTSPTRAPTAPTISPTVPPTKSPTQTPTQAPSQSPTVTPTAPPTMSPTTTPTKSDDSDNSETVLGSLNRTEAAIAIAVPVFVVLVIAIVGLAMCQRSNENKEKRTLPSENDDNQVSVAVF